MIIEKDKDNIINEKSGEILAKAIITDFNDNADSWFRSLIKEEILLIREFEDVQGFTDDMILEEFKENFEKMELYRCKLESKRVVMLDYIENLGKEKYAAKEIVDYLKKNYDSIILYSIDSAMSYWSKEKFHNFYGEYYIWTVFEDKNDY